MPDLAFGVGEKGVTRLQRRVGRGGASQIGAGTEFDGTILGQAKPRLAGRGSSAGRRGENRKRSHLTPDSRALSKKRASRRGKKLGREVSFFAVRGARCPHARDGDAD